ncbi:LysR family transcriptional regulator [Leuconostoc mesenteroides subsp. cremoris]|uniref:Transcriptional regulator, LysR family n=1 Tax=Leuconostoc mesenteroides subsp. cremoris ATCC 19254 TaxID=586220 RepID=C2KJ17_LEUMC|nr:transcriptional regulator, LysR family [Leuconostoc mesenteroides subsp. cremoris ATCC 19254]EQC85129.1 LysR family transcriptional regulator [Leuconostoc mesenteroides subsp. cremoris TIFN8]KDA52427.1 fhu operon transcription regulator [Leuconostoc mesenteroides subsp. cremoris T26]GEP16677.1 LysR family transcriptional regulator [Leuconostoc mesenteroides subsp. cremoris]
MSKAAAKLFTTQPNVSRVIKLFEQELASPLFERTSKVLKLTAYGKSIYSYAENILKNVNLITDTNSISSNNNFSVATYPSNIMSWLLVELYQKNPDMILSHQQGTVEEITTQVSQGFSELGILYVSQNQLKVFRHIISHKKLKFIEIEKRGACIYVGHNNPLYNKTSISFEELLKLKFVRGLNNFFLWNTNWNKLMLLASLQPTVYTNSEHLLTNIILETDVVELGINMVSPSHKQYDIKNLKIEGEDAYLTFGYVIQQDHNLSHNAQELLKSLEKLLKP